MLASFPLSPDREAFVFGLVPGVRATLVMQPRLNLRRIVSEDGKCRNAVFPIVLKLVVAPDNTEIGLKLIERAARAAKTIDHRLAMLVGMRLPFIRSPLPAPRLRPVINGTQMFGQRRICQTQLDAAG